MSFTETMAFIESGAEIGDDCVIHPFVAIYAGAKIGKGCKIQVGARIFGGVTLGKYVFVGPNATFTNVKYPRATKDADHFELTKVGDMATIGAGAVILCGIEIGEGAFVGAGAVVTKDVPPFKVVVGNPARIVR